jgi:hypothetical protein
MGWVIIIIGSGLAFLGVYLIGFISYTDDFTEIIVGRSLGLMSIVVAYFSIHAGLRLM